VGKKTNVYMNDEILIEKLMNRWKSKKTFYMNLHLKDGLGVEFIAC